MSILLWILIVLAVLALFGGGYGSTRGWGAYGWSPLGLIILVVLFLALTGNLHAEPLYGMVLVGAVNPTPGPVPPTNNPGPDPATPKAWYLSKTLWLGVLMTVIGIATYFSDPVHTPALNVASVSAAVGGVAMIVLRVWFTTAPVAGTALAHRTLRYRAYIKEKAGIPLNARETAALLERPAA